MKRRFDQLNTPCDVISFVGPDPRISKDTFCTAPFLNFNSKAAPRGEEGTCLQIDETLMPTVFQTSQADRHDVEQGPEWTDVLDICSILGVQQGEKGSQGKFASHVNESLLSTSITPSDVLLSISSEAHSTLLRQNKEGYSSLFEHDDVR
jgi:hypothetical protein